MSGHVRGDARKRSLESQHRLRIVNGLIVSCMCGAATNTDPYGDAVTTHIIAEAQTAALMDAADALPGFDTIRTHGDAAQWLRNRAGGVR